VENWQGPYLQKEIENDPWQHPYVYRFPGEHGDEPDIVSYGADGQPGGDGINADIVSWKN
jgi:general secretion pathway protein G